MKRFLLIAFLTLPLILGSWVDPSTIDVYSGMIQRYDYTYDVTDLSGYIDYYLISYDDFCLDSNGYLFNASSSTSSGSLRTAAGAEYEIRFTSRSGLEIQQAYTSSGYQRTAWIGYNLVPEDLPIAFTVSEFSIVAIAVILFIISALVIISRGAIL